MRAPISLSAIDLSIGKFERTDEILPINIAEIKLRRTRSDEMQFIASF